MSPAPTRTPPDALDLEIQDFITHGGEDTGSRPGAPRSTATGPGTAGTDTGTSTTFNDLALRLFARQFERNEAYRRLCRSRRVDPRRISHWSQIPSVPLTAFKRLSLTAVDPAQAQAVFMTSGSTDPTQRGRNHHPHLEVYDASLTRSFRDMFLPDAASMRILVLNPTPAQAPHSSIAYFFSRLMDEFGAPGSRFLVDEDCLQVDDTTAELRRAEAEGEPLAILGTSFSFVHLFDALEADGIRVQLPPGSRVLDTGGFKGRSREVTAHKLRTSAADLLGVPPARFRNYYGMTENSTQYYDRPQRSTEAAAENAASEDHRVKVVPHWARVLVVDPLTRMPVADGERGLLLHVDLANIGSCLAILSEDMGVTLSAAAAAAAPAPPAAPAAPAAPEQGRSDFILLGRAADAEARGCSLALDEILSAQARP